MKPIRPIILATLFLLVSTGMIWARVVQSWPYQKLLDMSDLVVIATPTSTSDTQEQTALPGLAAQPVIGIETRFAVSAVLKGDKALKDIVLHHYRFDKISVSDGPNFVSFVPADKRTYLLFLVREADGRYAPAFGQVDPGLCGISVLGEAPQATFSAPVAQSSDPPDGRNWGKSLQGVQLSARLRDNILTAESTIIVAIQIRNSSASLITVPQRNSGADGVLECVIDLTDGSGRIYEITPEPGPVYATRPPLPINAGDTGEWKVPVDLGKDIASGDYTLKATLRFGLNGHYFDVVSNLLKVQVK